MLCNREAKGARRPLWPPELASLVPTHPHFSGSDAGEPGRIWKAAPVSTGFAWLYTYLGLYSIAT
jgi:hypothetical protein